LKNLRLFGFGQDPQLLATSSEQAANQCTNLPGKKKRFLTTIKAKQYGIDRGRGMKAATTYDVHVASGKGSREEDGECSETFGIMLC
jgi:hypothetical protein